MLAVHCSSFPGLLPWALQGWKMSTLPVQGQSSPKDWDAPTATTDCISPGGSKHRVQHNDCCTASRLETFNVPSATTGCEPCKE